MHKADLCSYSFINANHPAQPLLFPLAHVDGNIDIARVLRDSDALYFARVLGLPHPCSRKGKIGALSENGTEQ